MGLQYVVAKRIFGFDKDKNVKYVAKSVGAGELDFDKLCAKVSRILGIHRKTVDLVAAVPDAMMSSKRIIFLPWKKASSIWSSSTGSPSSSTSCV